MSISQNGAHQIHEGPPGSMKKKGLSAGPPSPDDDTVSLRKQSRTWNYVWRSGVAGGLAGCAVSHTTTPPPTSLKAQVLRLRPSICTGQNDCSTA